LKRYNDTNKIGDIIWKEQKKMTFHNWHSETDQRDDEPWDDKNDDGETKTLKIHRNQTKYIMMMMMCIFFDKTLSFS
jgi:hypothetical protein